MSDTSQIKNGGRAGGTGKPCAAGCGYPAVSPTELTCGSDACLNTVYPGAGHLPRCPECAGAYDGFCIECEKRRISETEDGTE